MSALAGILVGFHALVAQRTGVEEWQMPMEEAEGVTKSVQNVLRHYSIETTQKAIDWGAMCVAIGSAYAPRILVSATRKKKQHTDNVVPFGTMGGMPQ